MGRTSLLDRSGNNIHKIPSSLVLAGSLPVTARARVVF